jgi:DNA-directed RNA polymerase subunit beta'
MLNPIRTTDFEAIKLKIASPEDIMSWSFGEVTRPETINYRTQKPEKNGLFCEKIFGPVKDYECHCGKYKKIRHKGIICEKCGVEITRSIVRRERMGHIKMETPATHIWFLRGLSSKLSLALGLSVQALEKVVYFASFIITDVNEELREATIEQIKEEYKAKKKAMENEAENKAKTIRAKKADLIKEGKSEFEASAGTEKEVEALAKLRDEKIAALEEAFAQAQKELKALKAMTVISENIYQNLSLKYGHIFTASIGAEAIYQLLQRLDLDKEIAALEKELVDAVESRKEKLTKRLKFFKNLRKNNIRPEWMIMTVIPVIPPDLRPMVALDGGRFATSDLNDLYRRIINRNNRLKQLIELSAPEVICRNEKRMLQEAVDALIDNSVRHGKTVVASTGQKRTLKSLADSLKGKQGRFRQNLLGKRVDYSGRSVITVNPKLKLYQCGIPKRMALELFKPFIISQLIAKEIVHNVRSASRYIEAGHDEVWDILQTIVDDSFVLLNRAPTLHRLGIQAFKPIMIEGLALQIHPLVCTAFNADFDGDQMAVHVPLTKEAREEAEFIMLASHNLLKPATGEPVVAPGQDIVWGVYYLTSLEEEVNESHVKYFSNPAEAKLAYDLGKIRLRQPIKVRLNAYGLEGLTDTTVGQLVFNEVLPAKLRFVNKIVAKSELKNLVKDCLRHYGEDETVAFVDNLKGLAFDYITKSGLSWGMDDLPKFEAVQNKITVTEGLADEVMASYEDGLLTESERYSKIIELWTRAKEEVTDICINSLDKNGPVYSMIKSGARGSWAQLTQILGMKGLVTSPSGAIIELPVKGNFKKGFDVLEYFIATHGVRKGLSDTALRTANAGYLTRRLVDVSQELVVYEEDCGTDNGITWTAEDSKQIGRALLPRITGRCLAEDLKNAKGKVVAKAGTLITEVMAGKLEKETINEARVRSLMTCQSTKGVCQKCYGYDLAYNKPVAIGTAVGIIAAQSIGEPGTQLTMRTFHTGGVAGGDDITQGLPRVEEVFEARTPKKRAFMADVAGQVKIETQAKTVEDKDGKVLYSNLRDKILQIHYEGEDMDRYAFTLIKAKGKKRPDILVATGDKIKKGAELFRSGEEVITAKQAGTIKLEKQAVVVAVAADKIKEYIIPRGFGILVADGDQVAAGDQLTEGSMDLKRLYELKGMEATQKYIIKEIQFVYSSQGQPLNDKHIETIARQMFSRVEVIDAGETDLMEGEIIEKVIFNRANARATAAGKQLATARQILLGITKVSLSTNSFLSAASFQETSRVLIDAAVTGKIDYLEGLKENVIIGRPIPAGTGFKASQARSAVE